MFKMLSALSDFISSNRKYLVLFSIAAGLSCMVILALITGRFADRAVDVFPSEGQIYYVSPKGSDSETGLDESKPLATIQLALNRARPGDTVRLADGAYYQNILSVRSGTQNARITIMGGKNAVIYGDGNRIIEIYHDFITLKGFQVNGQWGVGNSKEHYRDKLIYVIGKDPKKGVQGLKIDNLLVQNAGGECIRLRYFAKNNEISNSIIRNCGIYDFRFGAGGKNGEGIYIGTAPEQLADGRNLTDDPDVSANNHIHHNLIETYGNECVDIKESSINNIVEHNTCRAQKDPESGGFDSRGNNNIFRYNIVENTVGSAIRLGGDTSKDGINNHVYGNVFRDNDAGPLNVQRMPQGRICGNDTSYQDKPDSDSDDVDPTLPCD